jgi:hypothetical protein
MKSFVFDIGLFFPLLLLKQKVISTNLDLAFISGVTEFILKKGRKKGLP